MQYNIRPGKYHESFSNKEWYNQRNIEIAKDRDVGMSQAQLVTKYQISAARVYDIIKNERIKHEFRNTSNVA